MRQRLIFLLFMLIIPSLLASQMMRPMVKIHLQKGIEFYKEGKLEQAKQEFLIVLKNNQRNFHACEWLAQIFFQQKNFPEAMRFAEIAIQSNPDVHRSYIILSAIYQQSGDHEIAHRVIQRAMQRAKTNEDKEKIQKMREIFTEREKQHRTIPTEEIENVDVIDDTTVASAKKKPYIAVFPLEDSNLRTEFAKISETLTEMLSTALIQEDAFQVMERAQLQKILEEQALSQSGVIDSETAVKVGNLIGLEAVVIGSVSRLRSVIEGDVRLIEVETAKALTAANGKINNIDELRLLANNLGKQLAAKAYLVNPKSDQVKE